jgi:hypothetical protein
MGLFKSVKDMASLTKQAKQLQEQQQREAGYGPGFGGMMSQMGDMLEQANQQLGDLTDQSGERSRILAEGIAGEGVIVSHGVPARGAQWFNLDIELEVHVSGRRPYRVNNEYLVPATATLGPGVTLPIRVDTNDPAKIAIDWESAPQSPGRGEVRPASTAATNTAAGSTGFSPTPVGSGPAGGDSVAELERLAKLRDSGALTDAEFEQQKAKILGS